MGSLFPTATAYSRASVGMQMPWGVRGEGWGGGEGRGAVLLLGQKKRRHQIDSRSIFSNPFREKNQG